jgi:hypothetical protein
MENIEELKRDWFEENAPLGTKLGYPVCCILEFCDQPPAILKQAGATKDDLRRFEAAQINGKYTGFIPCKFHAKEILAGRITLASLIKDRSNEFPPFPDYASYTPESLK